MQKSLAAQIKQFGGQDIHVLWAKYFSQPAPQSSDPVISGLEIPSVDSAAIKKKIAFCSKALEVSFLLAAEFHFRDLPVWNIAAIAQQDHLTSVQLDDAKTHVFMLAAIAISFLLPKVLEAQKAGEPTWDYEWGFFGYPVVCLLTSSVSADAEILLQQYLESLASYQDIGAPLTTFLSAVMPTNYGFPALSSFFQLIVHDQDLFTLFCTMKIQSESIIYDLCQYLVFNCDEKCIAFIRILSGFPSGINESLLNRIGSSISKFLSVYLASNPPIIQVEPQTLVIQPQYYTPQDFIDKYNNEVPSIVLDDNPALSACVEFIESFRSQMDIVLSAMLERQDSLAGVLQVINRAYKVPCCQCLLDAIFISPAFPLEGEADNVLRILALSVLIKVCQTPYISNVFKSIPTVIFDQLSPLFVRLFSVDCNHFVSAFLNSGLIQEVKNSTCLPVLIQLSIVIDDVGFFSYDKNVSILSNLLLVPEYRPIISPCFKQGFGLITQFASSKSLPIVTNIVGQLNALIQQAMNDPSLCGVIDDFFDSFIPSIDSMTKDIASELIHRNYITAISEAASVTHSTSTLKKSLSVIAAIVSRFPSLNVELYDYMVYIALEKSISVCTVDDEIIDILNSLTIGEKDQIINRGSLRLLLVGVKGTAYQAGFVRNSIRLCQSSTSNAFEFFQADVIQFALENTQSIQLFEVVAPMFFTPYSLNEVFRAIYCSSEVVTDFQTQVMDSFMSLLGKPDSFTIHSFFHFSGATSGIIGPSSVVIPNNFVLTTNIRLGSSRQNEDALISFSGVEKSVFALVFVSRQLEIHRPDHSFQDKFNWVFETNQWHKLSLQFNGKKLILSVNDKVKETIDMPKFDSQPCMARVGSFEKIRFTGDIGCITLTQYEKPILTYNPANVTDRRVNDVTPEGEYGLLDGTAIPYSASIQSIVKQCAVFQHILPLFDMMNWKIETQTDVFGTIIRLLSAVLSIDISMEQEFLRINGLDLLVGLFLKIDPSKFNQEVPMALNNLFSHLRHGTLVEQMTELIWLNFDFWARMPYDVQVVALSNLANLAQCRNLDQLLLQIQTPISAFSKLQQRGRKVRSKLGVPLSEEEEKGVQRLHWIMFNQLFNRNSSPATFRLLFQLFAFHEDDFIRQSAGQSLEKYLDRCDDTIAQSFAKTNELISVLASPESFIQLQATRLLIIMDELGRRHMTAPLQLIRLVNYMIAALDISNSNIDAMVKTVFYALWDRLKEPGDEFLMSIEPFIVPDFLPFFFYLSAYAKKDTLRFVTYKVLKSLEEYSSSAVIFFSAPTWPFWLFLFTNATYSVFHTFEVNVVTPFVNAVLKQPAIIDFMIYFFHVLQTASDINMGPFVIKVFLVLLQKDPNPFFIGRAFQYLYFQTPSQNDFHALTTDELQKVRKTIVSGVEPHVSLVKEINPELALCLINTIPNVGFEEMSQLTPKYSMTLYLMYSMLIADEIDEQLRRQFNSTPVVDPLGQAIVKSAAENIEIPEVKEFRREFEVENLKMNQSINDYSVHIRVLLSECEMTPEILGPYEEGQTALKTSTKEFYTHKYLTECHQMKIATNFLRDATSNGGPLATKEDQEPHFSFNSQMDSIGRCLVEKRNFHFDLHRKESALRDSKPFDEQGQETVAPFKPIVFKAQSKKRESFKAAYLTITSIYSGSLHITDNSIYFEGCKTANGFNMPIDEPVPKFVEISIRQLQFIFYRMGLLQEISCEVFCRHGRSFLFQFVSNESRNQFLSTISAMCHYTSRKLQKYDFFEDCRRVCNGYVQTMNAIQLFSHLRMTDEWMAKRMSTYEYIHWLNMISGRSIHDLGQYPIYPWVLTEYSTDTIDLYDPANYRDFTKHIAAMNESRLSLCQRFMRELNTEVDHCLYRSHYSTAAHVINFMIRSEPFTSLHIALQDGKFDHPDRLFVSIPEVWNSVNYQQHDYRELIPQFFYDSHFMQNLNQFDLGTLQRNDQVVNDVELPKWAKSAFHFIQTNRAALESDIVRERIHDWFDLIFGCYQRDENHQSLWHLFSYRECVNSETVKDPVMWEMAKHHSANFGFCPERISNYPHPRFVQRSASSPQFDISLMTNSISGSSLFSDGHFIVTTTSLLVDVSTGQITKLQIKLGKDDRVIFTANCLVIAAPRASVAMIYTVNPTNGNCREIGSIKHEWSRIECLILIGHGLVGTGGGDCQFHLWGIPSLEKLVMVSVHSRPVVSAAANVDMGIVALVDKWDRLFLQAINPTRCLRVLNVEHGEHHVVVLKCGAVAISTGQTVQVFDFAGQLLETFDVGNDVFQLKVAENGPKNLILAIADKKIRVMDPSTLESHDVILDNYCDMKSIGVMENGQTIVSLSNTALVCTELY